MASVTQWYTTVSDLVHCYLSGYNVIFEIKWRIIKRLQGPKQYNTMNFSELVWGLSATHCFHLISGSLIRSSDAFIFHICILLLSPAIACNPSSLLSIGETQPLIHSECGIPDRKYRLSIDIIDNNQKLQKLDPVNACHCFCFLVNIIYSKFQGCPECSRLWKSFKNAKKKKKAGTTGSVQCWTSQWFWRTTQFYMGAMFL